MSFHEFSTIFFITYTDLRCDQIRDAIEDTSSEYEKEKMQERMARLSSGVAVLKIGGSSELEMNESTKSPQAEPAHVPKRACFPQAEPSQYSSLIDQVV